MSMLAICIILAATGQSGNAVVIEEAELAPPSGMTESAPAVRTTPQAQSSDMESGTSTTAPQSTTKTVQELQWEYDEEGKPVARPVTVHTETGTTMPELTPEPVPEPKPPVDSRQSSQQERPKSGGSQHVATFWFVLPK